MCTGSFHAVTAWQPWDQNSGEVEPRASKLLDVAEIDPLRCLLSAYKVRHIAESTFNINKSYQDLYVYLLM
jgi:hypothetical protein